MKLREKDGAGVATSTSAEDVDDVGAVASLAAGDVGDGIHAQMVLPISAAEDENPYGWDFSKEEILDALDVGVFLNDVLEGMDTIDENEIAAFKQYLADVRHENASENDS